MTTRTAPEEMDIFRDTLLRILDKEVAPYFETWEKTGLVPRELWATLGAAGVLCVDMPEQYGSAAAGFDVAQMICEEISRRGYGGLASGYNIHANIVAPYILHLGNDEQRAAWLPGMIRGETIGCIGMTEPGCGSDLAALKTSAVRDGDEYVINGSKTFITNGINSDLAIVAAKTEPTAGAKGVSLFLVDATLPGFSKGKQIQKIGQHSSDTAELFFDDLRIPASALLGKEGMGFVYLMQELCRERLGCAVQAVGQAQGALDITLDYVQARKAFGQSIAGFQNTRFKLAQVRTDIEVCRAYVEKCIDRYLAGSMSAEDAAIVKLSATEMQCQVVNECLQLFGGYGYTAEYPISRFYVDARIQTIYGGTSEIMKEVIARSLLGK
ncbi:acyl-CoA dehydrogenase [Pseudomaricurvus alkylphenolicus]|uniref:acyl-CoA dehydrogenase family protein n=1 Tax=Pseudomaricurvus alkylphenolicus TaxID=1306991 RepID=UPI00141E0634|nr:acyl-CoA dehydrogenase family protein [Pseudomaricurvus alkylphenolicus]NIB42500.1 acyl-CoA dehydrogenase [Pseudomaricurvus alkylphenolicus]